MTSALHVKTEVLPGNRIEVSAPEFSVGAAVEVFVVSSTAPEVMRPSAWEILRGLPGRRLFRTPEEADRYLEQERNSWES